MDKLPETVQQEPITIFPESITERQQFLQEIRDCLEIKQLELKKDYGIELVKGNCFFRDYVFTFHLTLLLGKASIQQITNKLRTISIINDLETLINRPIDEVDILNMFNGHINNLLNEAQLDANKTNTLVDQNIQRRLMRINERIQLVYMLKNDIENNRLKRMR